MDSLKDSARKVVSDACINDIYIAIINKTYFVTTKNQKYAEEAVAPLEKWLRYLIELKYAMQHDPQNTTEQYMHMMDEKGFFDNEEYVPYTDI